MPLSAAARFRCTLAAGAMAVVIGSGFTAVGLNRSAGAEASTAAQSVDRTTSTGSADSPLKIGATPTTPETPTTPATPTTPQTRATAVPTVSPPPERPAARTKPRTTKVATRAPAAPEPAGSTVVAQVLEHINAARRAEGLRALALDEQLSQASALHNELMIDGCGLAHQCPGEAGPGVRFSAQGVRWSTAGENIGFGSSGAGDAQVIAAANGLTDSMLAEVPPNDGHRRNLLNAGFGRIGLSIVRDSKGATWMTQDFVN